LTRTVRRILGSCFRLPKIGSNESHNLKTIDITAYSEPYDITRGTSPQQFNDAFLRALRAFALKEFTYQIRNLDEQDLSRIELWSEINAKCGEQVEFDALLKGSRVYSKLNKEDLNSLSDRSKKRKTDEENYIKKKNSENTHPDEKVVSIMASYLVMIAVFRYE